MNRVFSFQGLWSQRSRDPTRRNWIADTGDDKNEADGSNRKPPSSNKDNEEPEVPSWKRRQEERREREKLQERGRKKQEKESESESERRTEREKEKEKVKEEKEVDDSSQSAEARARRKRMLIEKRRTGVSVVSRDIPFLSRKLKRNPCEDIRRSPYSVALPPISLCFNAELLLYPSVASVAFQDLFAQCISSGQRRLSSTETNRPPCS